MFCFLLIITGNAAKVIGVAADVTSESSLRASVATIQAAFPDQRVGAVFANAGVSFLSGGN